MAQRWTETVAEELALAADDLERASRHLRTSARHFREREVPRGGAHAFAARGHLREAEDRLDRQAAVHAAHAEPD